MKTPQKASLYPPSYLGISKMKDIDHFPHFVHCLYLCAISTLHNFTNLVEVTLGSLCGWAYYFHDSNTTFHAMGGFEIHFPELSSLLKTIENIRHCCGIVCLQGRQRKLGRNCCLPFLGGNYIRVNSFLIVLCMGIMKETVHCLKLVLICSNIHWKDIFSMIFEILHWFTNVEWLCASRTGQLAREI